MPAAGEKEFQVRIWKEGSCAKIEFATISIQTSKNILFIIII